MKIRKTHAALASVIVAVSVAGTGVALADGHDAKSEHWGIIDRNTIGSPVAELRDGPFAISPQGSVTSPPFGKGSLGIEVANDGASTTTAEKVSFGNEVDFAGDPVSGLTQVGFQIFETAEDTQTPGSPFNLPNITLEINPDKDNATYTSMVWNPAPLPADELDQWSPYLDAASTSYRGWYFTGSFGQSSVCNLGHPCTLGDAVATLGPNATIDSVAVAKGRDYAWQGAVDGLRINDQVFDFEKDGVHAHHANSN